MNKAIGQPIRRKEDVRLLTGRGRFSDDFTLPGQAYAAMVRSPHPHATIDGVLSDVARKMPGVLGVFTGADCAADGLGPIPHSPLPNSRHDLKLSAAGGGAVFIGPHTLLPDDKARHVGEAVAVVIAESAAQALDAAEAVDVTYTTLPHNCDGWQATQSGNEAVWDEVPDNVCIDATFGDVAGTDKAFKTAAHVLKASFHIDRVTGVPLEPRSALATYDQDSGRYTLYAGSGGAVRQKGEIAAVLGVEADNVRILSFDVGGNFGTRNRVYVEFALVAWASKKIGRPVKYTCVRSDAFLSDYQGRDLYTRVELALDQDGRFLAMRADNISNAGARAVSFSPLSKGSALITGPYRIPYASVRSRSVFTNTVPTQAYRSSGRVEVTFAVERLVEHAAVALNMDAVELRRINLIEEQEMPYTNPLGLQYDSGRYHLNMDKAMRLVGWDNISERRMDARKRGKRLGVGFAAYVESSIGTPWEQAKITVKPEGTVEVVIGTQPSGQGHETSFAQVAADWLGIAVDQVQIVIGDTDIVKVGGGSHSGRSMRMAGTVITMAADDLIKKGKRIAAQVLQAAAADVQFADGVFAVTGTGQSIDLFTLAGEAERDDMPDELAGGLNVVRDNEMQTPVFPNGCHICEVEIDPETGAVDLVRYAAIDDVGRAINPLIVHGQTHGAVVQGLGQAMIEVCVLDPKTGQPLSGSLMDYGLLRADDVPSFAVELNEVLSPTNPLGIKAGGEGGTTVSPAVYINALIDGLKEFGVIDIKMPATPQNIWHAIQTAKT